MKPQKIANYEQRMQMYREECRTFWMKDFLLVAVIVIVVIFSAIFGLTKLNGYEPILNLDWRQLALLFWIVAMIPPWMMMHPTKPKPSDVLLDQALRRAAGMDDSVSD